MRPAGRKCCSPFIITAHVILLISGYLDYEILCLLQAMVTRFSSISTRKLSNALKILTSDKCMVATSDYNEFHKTVKRHILTNFLGANAQVGCLFEYLSKWNSFFCAWFCCLLSLMSIFQYSEATPYPQRRHD